jgi:hypothetical protein
VVDVVVIKVVCAASFEGQVRLRVLSWYPSASTAPQTKVSDPPGPSHWRAQVQVVSKPARGILLNDAGLSNVRNRFCLPVTQMFALQDGSFQVRSVQVPRYERLLSG